MIVFTTSVNIFNNITKFDMKGMLPDELNHFGIFRDLEEYFQLDTEDGMKAYIKALIKVSHNENIVIAFADPKVLEAINKMEDEDNAQYRMLIREDAYLVSFSPIPADIEDYRNKILYLYDSIGVSKEDREYKLAKHTNMLTTYLNEIKTLMKNHIIPWCRDYLYIFDSGLTKDVGLRMLNYALIAHSYSFKWIVHRTLHDTYKICYPYEETPCETCSSNGSSKCLSCQKIYYCIDNNTPVYRTDDEKVAKDLGYNEVEDGND